MSTKKDFIKAVISDQESKYISVTDALCLLVRIQSKAVENSDLPKVQTRTIEIKHPENRASILAALKEAKVKREELYYERHGLSLNEWLARSKKSGSKNIYNDTQPHNQSGYPSVFINITTHNDVVYFKGFLASVFLHYGTRNRKLFNFGRVRTEDEAFIEACKKSDEWHGRTLKKDSEYLEMKKEINWEEKIDKLKVH